jgi:putative holliday junction resolvase
MQNKTIVYLGIDWGEVRLGLAMGDSSARTAVPIETVSNLDAVLDIVKNESIDEVIIGEPVKMSGDKKTINKKYLQFIKQLKSKVDIPVRKYDERLSSKAADALIGDKKTKAGRDSIAAMIILQGYLDFVK